MNRQKLITLYLQVSDAYKMISDEYSKKEIEQDMIDELRSIIIDLLSKIEKEIK